MFWPMLPSNAGDTNPVLTDWGRATLALHMLAIDPAGLGGMVVRARSGPVRSRFEHLMGIIDLPAVRLHPGTDDAQLFGGLDVTATLDQGKTVFYQGITSKPHVLTLTMAERCPSALSARLSQIMDTDTGHCLIALDEGAEDEEFAPRTLAERVAFHVNLDNVGWMNTSSQVMGLTGARALYARVPAGTGTLEKLTQVAASLGIPSLRAPQFAVRAARAHAVMHGRDHVTEDDIGIAAVLVYASRAAVHMHEEEPEIDAQDPPPPPDHPDDADETSSAQTDRIPDEMLIEAVRAMLPQGLLNMAVPAQAGSRGPSSSGAGQRKKGAQRGRPLPARAGHLGTGARLDLLATLRAAAPWQRLRNAQVPGPDKLRLRSSDFHIKRYEERSDRLLIFAVDASGSAAMARLGEAKGAVELLLADAYSSRDHVALVAFRGEGAEVLLPPTKSLVQAKRRLSALPGGGGTPLASGLRDAFAMAEQARTKGMTPTMILLTDGRGNINLDGAPGRASAMEDTSRMAKLIRASGHRAIVLDVAPRPRGDSANLAQEVGGTYVPLPRADSARIQSAVSAAIKA